MYSMCTRRANRYFRVFFKVKSCRDANLEDKDDSFRAASWPILKSCWFSMNREESTLLREVIEGCTWTFEVWIPPKCLHLHRSVVCLFIKPICCVYVRTSTTYWSFIPVALHALIDWLGFPFRYVTVSQSKPGIRRNMGYEGENKTPRLLHPNLSFYHIVRPVAHGCMSNQSCSSSQSKLTCLFGIEQRLVSSKIMCLLFSCWQPIDVFCRWFATATTSRYWLLRAGVLVVDSADWMLAAAISKILLLNGKSLFCAKRFSYGTPIRGLLTSEGTLGQKIATFWQL